MSFYVGLFFVFQSYFKPVFTLPLDHGWQLAVKETKLKWNYSIGCHSLYTDISFQLLKTTASWKVKMQGVKNKGL